LPNRAADHPDLIAAASEAYHALLARVMTREKQRAVVLDIAARYDLDTTEATQVLLDVTVAMVETLYQHVPAILAPEVQEGAREQATLLGLERDLSQGDS
jgi:spore maturation protein SpmB